MAFRIRISAPALKDLDELLRHVKPELWDWAGRMATEAIQDVRKLEGFPRSARLVGKIWTAET
jgi:hypothetical protein